MFLRVLSAEILKLKRTLALWMVLVSPLVMISLQFAISYKAQRAASSRAAIPERNSTGPAAARGAPSCASCSNGAAVLLRGGKDAWQPMVTQTVEVWTLLMMPMFVTLETSLLAGLEDTGNNWKSLLALPAPRWTIYAAKLSITILLLWAAHALLIGGTIASGRLLRALYPALNFRNMPLAPFLAPMARVSVTALVGVAIQHWVSLRWHNYTVAMGFGMCAMIVGVFAVQSASLGSWFPWSLPIRAVMNGAAAGDRLTIGAVCASCVAALTGCWEFVNREIG